MGILYRYVGDIPNLRATSPVNDLHQLEKVLQLNLRYPRDDESAADIDFRIQCRPSHDAHDVSEVILRVQGVRQLIFGEILPRLWLVELEIEDLRPSGLEAIRFRIFSRYDRAIDLSCAQFSLALPGQASIDEW